MIHTHYKVVVRQRNTAGEIWERTEKIKAASVETDCGALIFRDTEGDIIIAYSADAWKQVKGE